MTTTTNRTLPLLVAATVLGLGAFHWGQAVASSRGELRRRTAVVDAVDHASPAVVNVTAVLRGGRSHGVGAGVIVHPSGYVVTNSHVIRGASHVSVQPFRTKGAFHARVIADHPQGDLALLKLDGSRRWPYVSLSPTSEVILGETAIAIGNPRGLGDSITVGVVSAVGRAAKIQSGSTIRGLIQTDASINTGNSGGPLINLDGELIGINASVLPSAHGIAFAIPADHVRALLERSLGRTAPPNALPEPEPPVRPTSTPRAVPPVRPPALASRRPDPDPVREPESDPEPESPAPLPPIDEVEVEPLVPSDLGIHVEDDGRCLLVGPVPVGTPASKAGLRMGDAILDVDGLPVEALGDLHIAFATSTPGRTYYLNVRRGSGTRPIEIVVPR